MASIVNRPASPLIDHALDSLSSRKAVALRVEVTSHPPSLNQMSSLSFENASQPTHGGVLD